MKWNKKTVRAIITAIVVAFVGYETQIIIQDALNMDSNRDEMIRRIGRSRRRRSSGSRDSGDLFNDDNIALILKA